MRKQKWVLVRVGESKRWSTRPPLVRDEADLMLIRRIGAAIETAGFPAPKALMFLGRATRDLIVAADDPRAVAEALRDVLRDLPVQVAALGRHGDLTYWRHLWRHM